jgi:predicted RNA binding protein with dsRBD fold (UPF0201 family)
MVEIRLSARCYPTENRGKIVEAIVGLFPDAEVDGDDPIVGRSTTADAFGDALRRHRIRDAARAIMRRGRKGNSTKFLLNKQVATIGKVSFSEENHPLGDIEVTMTSDNIDELIDSIAPNTRMEKET